MFSGSLPDFLFALILMTLAILITVAAMIFAAAVTVVALTATAGALALVAGVAGLPFLLIAAVVWWALRRNKPPLATVSPGAQG